VTLHDNRETIRANVQRESPWWLPGFVDDRVVVQMLDRIETHLLEMSLDPDHPMRADFNRWAAGLADKLQRAPEYRGWGEKLKSDLLANQGLQDYLFTLWSDLVAGLESDLRDPDSRLRSELGRSAAHLAAELENDQAMQDWANAWLVELAVVTVKENRFAMAGLISDTVRSWDADQTSRRIEQAIGRDLQFIRVNGTLVGGLAGLAIHALKAL